MANCSATVREKGGRLVGVVFNPPARKALARYYQNIDDEDVRRFTSELGFD